MLRSLNEIFGYTMAAIDGEIGTCRDALFDDETWTLRYLDIDTGNWLPGRRVLISPISLGRPGWSTDSIPTKLTTHEIEESPGLEFDEPVNRQWEDSYNTYFGWPHYAVGGSIWGYSAYPHEVQIPADKPGNKKAYDPHLRSAREVLGYGVVTVDSEFGGIKDFIFDTETWSMPCLVISMNKWLPSKTTLVSTDWVEGISLEEQSIHFKVGEKEIKKAPVFDGETPINRELEVRFYDFYGRPNDERRQA